MNMVDKSVLSKKVINIASRLKDLQKNIKRLPISLKKDEAGILQKDKRILTQKIDTIYKEMLSIKNNIEEEKKYEN